MATKFALKFHSFTTDPGNPPYDGFPSADFRGDKWVGSPQGDEHHCLLAVKSLPQEAIDALLIALPEVNKALATGETILPPGVPHLRAGIWDNDR